MAVSTHLNMNAPFSDTAKAVLHIIHTTFNLTSEPSCSMGTGLSIVKDAASSFFQQKDLIKPNAFQKKQ